MKKLLIVMLIALLGCVAFSTAALAEINYVDVGLANNYGYSGVYYPGTYGLTVDIFVNDYYSTSKVELYADGVFVGEGIPAMGCDPYFNLGWNPPAGVHTLVAKAYDTAGNVKMSTPWEVKIGTIVNITSPAYNSTVSGIVTNFSATTTDPVIKADLKIDGVFKTSQEYSTGTTNPVVSYNWDTNQYTTSGYHTIEMICYTQNGNVASSGTRQVMVGTILTYIYPEEGSYVWGTITSFGATANNQIQRADLYIDGVKCASNESVNGTNISISYNWDTTQFSDYSTHNIEIRAYTAGGTEVIGRSAVQINNYDQGW